MGFCTECGNEIPAAAKFCSSCGASALVEQAQQAALSPTHGWLRFDDVINDRSLRLGAIGSLVAFLSAFCPWVSQSVSVLGYTVGSSAGGSPFAWLVALAAIGAAVFLFRPASGSIVLVTGIVTGALVVLSVVTAQGSPSWGVLLALAGGGLMAYSGHLSRSQELA